MLLAAFSTGRVAERPVPVGEASGRPRSPAGDPDDLDEPETREVDADLCRLQQNEPRLE